MTDREKVFGLFEGHCAYCGECLVKGWHIDHIQPVRRHRGYMMHPERDVIANKFPSCASCNINKHGKSIEGFRQFIKNMIVSLNRDHTIYKISKRYGLVVEVDKPVEFYFEKYYHGFQEGNTQADGE